MQTSETIDAIAAALAKAQGEIHNPAKSKQNPHFRSSYADLAGGLDVIRPALSKHGLSFVQTTSMDGDLVVLHTRLMHTSGQWLEGTYPVTKLGKHQDMMSALTYSKRAALFALVGVAGEDDDDDGNAAGTADTSRLPDTRRAGDKARSAATVEAKAYAEHAIKAVRDIESVDRLDVWWQSEKANRQLHFTSSDDPQFVRLKEAVKKRGDELRQPVADAAE